MAPRVIHRLARTRLQQFIIAELCAFGGGVSLSLELYFWVLPSPWLLVLALVCAAHCLTLGAALFLWRGAHQRKVTVVCVGNWASALIVTFIAPVMLPVMVLGALLPVLFAEHYVRGRRLKTFIVITAGCALALGVIARLQDGAGLTDLIPDSVLTFVIITTLPIMAGLILLIAWHNGAALRKTAQTAQGTAAALQTSQELLAERAAQLTASRARLITAADKERRRIERDLHDGAQQHLVALAVLIQLARTADADRSQILLIEASTLLNTAIAEIRRLAHGIYPPLLISGGLARALPATTAHAAVPVQLNLQELARYPAPIEAALYYCCSEALQNAAKHGGPDTTVTITACADDEGLTVAISDTGPGFHPATIGTGLTNMTDRLAAIGGKLVIDTAPGRGTRITATVLTAALKRAAAPDVEPCRTLPVSRVQSAGWHRERPAATYTQQEYALGGGGVVARRHIE